MLEPDFDPAPIENRAMRLPVTMSSNSTLSTQRTIVLLKIDPAGRPVRQIELCDRHAEAVVTRERKRGFEVFDRCD